MSELELLAVLIVAAHGALFAAAFAYNTRTKVRFEQRFTSSYTAAVLTGVGGFAVSFLLVAVFWYSDIGRLAARRLGVLVMLFPAGLIVVSVGVGNARTWVRSIRRGDAPTGAVTPGPVAATGVVPDDESTAPTPVFGTRAVCWEWWFRQKRDTHAFESGASDDPFRIDDGSGPVRVDPEGARLDLQATVANRDPDERFDAGSDVVTDLEAEYGDTERQYRETALTPGTEVTVLGRAVERDGTTTITGDDDGPFVITDGNRGATLRRYRNRAVGYAAGGLALAFLALRFIAIELGASVPP